MQNSFLFTSKSNTAKNLKFLAVCCAVLLGLTTHSFAQNKKKSEFDKVGADKPVKIAVIMDDSGGMCGYMGQAGNGSYFKKTISALQLTIESAPNAKANLAKLSQVNAMKPAANELALLLNKSSEKDCPFKADTSKLQSFFAPATSGNDLTVMITDMIFDTGSAAGTVDGRVALVNEAAKWSKAQKSNGNYLNSGFGIIGLDSKFEGTYYTADDKPLKMNESSRPYYIMWRSTNNEKVYPVLNAFLSNLAPTAKLNKDGKSEVDQKTKLAIMEKQNFHNLAFLPFLDTSKKFNSLDIKTTKEIIQEKKSSYGVSYQFNSKSQTPADAQDYNPRNCFRLVNDSIEFNKLCGGGKIENKLAQFSVLSTQGLTGARLWFEINNTPGLVRSFKQVEGNASVVKLSQEFLQTATVDVKNANPNSTPVLSNGNHYFGKNMLQTGKSYLVVSIPSNIKLLSNEYKDGVPSPDEITVSWKEQFTSDDSISKKYLFASAAAMHSDTEPCPAENSSSNECKDANATTIGFKILVESLANRLNSSATVAQIKNAELNDGNVIKFKIKAAKF